MPPREPRKNKKSHPQDSKALNQIARLIDVRLPDQHGFCLLTFPLGAAVDPRIRYVGKGDREDIIKTLEFWCQQQRSGGLGFGTHSDRPEPSQWHTQKPTEEGIYWLRYPADGPDKVHPVKLSFNEATTPTLMIEDWDGDQWGPSFETVDTISENHLWLGPIPQPWLNSQLVEIPEPEDMPEALDWRLGDGRPPTYVADGDSFTMAGRRFTFRDVLPGITTLTDDEVAIGATPQETADNLNAAVGANVATVSNADGRPRLVISAADLPLNVVTPQFGEAVPPIESSAGDAWFDRIEAHHEEAMVEMTERLMQRYPTEGGIIDSETLTKFLMTAFVSGVSAQSLNPIAL